MSDEGSSYKLGRHDDNRKSHRGLSYVATAIIFLIIGIMIGAGGKSSSSTKNPSNSASQNTSASTASTSPTPSPATKAAPPKVLLDQTGSGQAQTKPFTTGNSWTVTYTFDCTSFGDKGNFQYDI